MKYCLHYYLLNMNCKFIEVSNGLRRKQPRILDQVVRKTTDAANIEITGQGPKGLKWPKLVLESRYGARSSTASRQHNPGKINGQRAETIKGV